MREELFPGGSLGPYAIIVSYGGGGAGGGGSRFQNPQFNPIPGRDLL